MKLHKKGQSIKEVVIFINYMVSKEEIRKIIILWVCIRKLKKREQRKHYTPFKVGDWVVWREYYFFVYYKINIVFSFCLIIYLL